MMIFVPLSRPAATALEDSGVSAEPVTGYAATPGLFAGLGYDPTMDEDANFQAQTHAMVAGLVGQLWADGNRLVLAADVPDRLVSVDPTPPAELGVVQVAELSWSSVGAVFSDGAEPDTSVSAAVRSATAAVAGVGLSEAVDQAEVEQLIAEHDLLWHVPDEPW